MIVKIQFQHNLDEVCIGTLLSFPDYSSFFFLEYFPKHLFRNSFSLRSVAVRYRERVTQFWVTLFMQRAAPCRIFPVLKWERNIHAKYIRECRYFGVLLFGECSPLFGKSFVLIDRPDLLSLNCTELNSVNQLLLENKKDNRTGQHHI